VKSAALGQLDDASRRRALNGLEATNEDSGFAADVRTLLANAPSVPDRKESTATRAARELRRHYLALTARPGFVLTLDVFFTILAVGAILTVLGFVFDGPGVVTFDEWAALISSMVANACIIVGVFLLRRHERMRAYRWFDRGLLISIFVTQVFVFAEEQLGGTVGLVVVLVIWVLLRGAMRAESDRLEMEGLEREEGAPAP
jgi:cytochrome c oxidase subunit IV